MLLFFFAESEDYSVTVNLRLWNYGCLLRSYKIYQIQEEVFKTTNNGSNEKSNAIQRLVLGKKTKNRTDSREL